ncbi:MAG: hypothetical protein ACREK8_05135 [Gemmatimonadales bacterium]
MSSGFTSLRRALAAFATVGVLLAPVTSLAHARMMLQETMSDCGHPAAHHAMAPAVPQHSRHQHTGSCCDLCPGACQTAALTACGSGMPPIVTHVVAERVSVGHELAPRRTAHLLPFSHAPPVISA